MYYKQLNYSAVLLVCMLLASCYSSGRYEKRYHFSNKRWNRNDKKHFEFYIGDTTANYNIHFLIGHGNQYAYSNVWLDYDMVNPKGKKNLMRLEMNMQNPDGNWMGRGFYDEIDQKLNITPNATPLHFNMKGKYTVDLSQIMRDEDLAEVSYIGLNVEKVLKQ